MVTRRAETRLLLVNSQFPAAITSGSATAVSAICNHGGANGMAVLALSARAGTSPVPAPRTAPDPVMTSACQKAKLRRILRPPPSEERVPSSYRPSKRASPMATAAAAMAMRALRPTRPHTQIAAKGWGPRSTWALIYFSRLSGRLLIAAVSASLCAVVGVVVEAITSESV